MHGVLAVGKDGAKRCAKVAHQTPPDQIPLSEEAREQFPPFKAKKWALTVTPQPNVCGICRRFPRAKQLFHSSEFDTT